MAGFGDASLNVLVQEDTYEKIGSYILICCEEMKENLGKVGRKLPNDENKIRNYLLENYLDDLSNRKKHNVEMFHFIPEGQENYDDDLFSYKGRVDIKIVNQNEWFENGHASYFVECKRIDGSKKLNKEYVVSGIARFVVKPPLYNSFYNKNYMLGFQVKDIKTDENVKKIELIQQSCSDIENICGLIRSVSGTVFVYDCKYKMDEKVLEIRHMFVDFSKVIGKVKYNEEKRSKR